MQILDDAGLPYGCWPVTTTSSTAGNGYDQYYQYFGEDRYAGRDYSGGAMRTTRGTTT